MAYRTCVGCANEKKPCVARDQLRGTLKGFGVTSIKWKCKDRVPRIRIGDPVWALTVASKERVDGEGEPYRDQFPAFAVRESGPKIIVYIKPETIGRSLGADYPFKGSGFCKLPLSRVEVREGERVDVCRHCGQPDFLGHVFGYACNPDDRGGW